MESYSVNLETNCHSRLKGETARVNLKSLIQRHEIIKAVRVRIVVKEERKNREKERDYGENQVKRKETIINHTLLKTPY